MICRKGGYDTLLLSHSFQKRGAYCFAFFCLGDVVSEPLLRGIDFQVARGLEGRLAM